MPPRQPKPPRQRYPGRPSPPARPDDPPRDPETAPKIKMASRLAELLGRFRGAAKLIVFSE
jgi:hypothetical protein